MPVQEIIIANPGGKRRKKRVRSRKAARRTLRASHGRPTNPKPRKKVSLMARKRRKPAVRHAKRRRRNPVGLAAVNPRGRRSRRHNPSHRRRRSCRRHNPFGLGKGKGILGSMPDMMVVVGGVAGGILTPVLLAKTKIAQKLPAGNVGLLVQAGIGVVIGGLLAKFVGKKLGAAYALGAVIVPAVGLVASSGFLKGIGLEEPYELEGGDYSVSGAVSELDGVGDLDELEGLGEEISELE